MKCFGIGCLVLSAFEWRYNYALTWKIPRIVLFISHSDHWLSILLWLCWFEHVALHLVPLCLLIRQTARHSILAWITKVQIYASRTSYWAPTIQHSSQISWYILYDHEVVMLHRNADRIKIHYSLNRRKSIHLYFRSINLNSTRIEQTFWLLIVLCY